MTRDLWHSCTDATVDDFLRRASPRTRALYARFESMIAACGPYHVSPAKTRIAFMARVRFGGVKRIDTESMTIGFALPKPLRNPRSLEVGEVAPGWRVHVLRLTRPAELDGQLQRWLRESYRLMGMRERLRGKRARAAGAGRSRRSSRA